MMYTNQQIFNKVARHLLKQGKKSKNKAMMDDEGCRCSIGCFIPKKKYPKIRHRYYMYFETFCKLNFGDWYGYRQNLLIDLQDVHDGHWKPSQWAARLRAIARKYKLEIPNFLKDIR